MLLLRPLGKRSVLGNENFCFEPEVLRVCFDASMVNELFRNEADMFLLIKK